jgi:circadian clock protein KaiC
MGVPIASRPATTVRALILVVERDPHVKTLERYFLEEAGAGNAQADLILGGGFPAHSISIVMGQPGSGKTVFSEQLAFANRGARPVLYLTTLSEPLPKVLTDLQEFEFTDVNAIGSEIVYESIADTVTREPQKLAERSPSS